MLMLPIATWCVNATVANPSLIVGGMSAFSWAKKLVHAFFNASNVPALYLQYII